MCKQFHKKTQDGILRTNLQTKLALKWTPETIIITKLQGCGPRASHTGPERNPVMTGGKSTSSEQS